MKRRAKAAGTRERTYRYRFYPSASQAEQLAKTFGACRWVYNQGLELRRSGWEQYRVSVGYAETCRALTGWRRAEETSWLAEVSSTVLQQSLRHLDAAFQGFFRGARKHPKRKRKHVAKDSATYVRLGMGFRWVEDPDRAGTGLLTLAKQTEPLAVRWSRPLPSGVTPVKLTVTRDRAGRHFVAVLVEEVIEPLAEVVDPECGEPKVVGVDVGIASLVTLDDGTKIDHPRLLRKYADRLARLQRQLHRRRAGSKNRAKVRAKIARLYALIRDVRRDVLDQVTTRLVRENQVLVVEDLAIASLMRAGGRRKARLNGAIIDASWGELLRLLTYKAEWGGRTLVIVDRFFPSTRRCSVCHADGGPKGLSVRSWTCVRCDTTHDRDVNAAANLREEGLRLYRLVADALPAGRALPAVIRASALTG
ncbi:RNA-guided endonuclease InsQ/TnpB family protein [Streptomyces sp. NPDC091376]|uniref:RNA-guided endonuclease InsQ/TnpB family protein n=1 Tax=Streptomyces sp. NPDC091376 TaxID=3365994 RepID=UPI00380CFDFF